MRMHVEGLPDVKRALAKLRADMYAGSAEGQVAGATAVYEDWRELAPVDEGTHRDGLGHDADSAYATAEHSNIVEFGSSTHAPHNDGSEAAARGAAKVPGLVAVTVKKRLPR